MVERRWARGIPARNIVPLNWINTADLENMLEKLLLLGEKYPLDFISHLSSSFPFILGLIQYKFLAFFALCFVKETIALWLSLQSHNNLFLQNIEPIYGTILIGIIFYYSFEASANRRIIASCTALSILITVVFYKNTEVSSVSLSTFRLLAIGLILAYFSKLMMDMRVKNIMKYSMFWFTSGLLIYTAGTFFIVLLSEYWYQDINKVPIEVFDRYWNSSQILFILFALFSGVGIWFSKYDSDNLI
jgi:hypothetical protein